MKRFCVLLILILALSALMLTACSPGELAVPTGLVYADGLLSWDEVDGAIAYRVEIDGVDVAEVRSAYYAYAVSGQTTFRVAAVGDKGQVSRFSAELRHTPVVDNRTALNTPTIIEVNGQGVLSWSYVVNASGYRIYLNGSAHVTVSGRTNYTLAVTTPGAYTVQVQAMGEGDYRDSARSAIYRIEVGEDGKVKAPKLRTPTISYNPDVYRVEWLAVSNAVAYDVYQNGTLSRRISADDATAHTAQGTGMLYYYFPSINVRNTRLHVVAVADGVNYADSTGSNVLAFPLQAEGVPTGLHTEVVDGSVVVAWDRLINCASYRLKIEADGAVVGIVNPTTNRERLSLADGTYRISVAGDGDGYIFSPTEYSAQIEVTFAGGSPLPIRLDEPQNPYVYEKSIFWQAVPHASGYQVYIDTPYDDTQGSYTLDAAAAQLALPAYLYDTVLTIYVRAIGEGACANSYWSEGTCYYPVDEDPLDEIVVPAYSVQSVPTGLRMLRDTLVWNGVVGATDYELVVDGVAIVLSECRYTPDMSTAHLVKVRALSHDELVLDSPYTAEFYVARERLSTPTDLTIRGGTLSWSSVGAAAGYVVQIDDDFISQNGTTIDLSTALPYDGTYVVRVMATSAEAYLDDSLYSGTLTFVADYEKRGTEHKPYKIATKADLSLLVQYPTAFFVLTADVDVGDIAPLFTAQNAFAGSLDGNGHTLSNICLASGDVPANGLLGCLAGATLKNIHLQFASVAFNQNYAFGVLAGLAENSVFDGVHLSATVAADQSFGTVGESEGCTYHACVFDVRYTQTSATASVGGYAAKSRRDTFDACAVTGSLSGGVYMGAIAAQTTDSTLAVTVGSATAPFVYTADGAYVGAVGKGTVGACAVDAWADYHLSGNVYAGAAGGQLSADLVSGNMTVRYHAQGVRLLYVGGAVGYGLLDVVDCAVDMRLEGSATTLYAGGAVGYGMGLCVCRNSAAFALSVDVLATEGRYVGGVVGFGTASYAGEATGNIVVNSTVSVGRVSGTEPTPTQGESWIVSDKE